MKCAYCKRDDHPWWDCRTKPEGWKPPKRGAEAGTGTGQARQRDAAGSSMKADLSSASSLTVPVVGGSTPLSPATHKKRGRPITVNTPRAEYQRELMRKRRAKEKKDE